MAPERPLAASPHETEPAVLSPEEFVARALSLSPKIAVFDCDGTLWSGDAGSGFMRWTMDTGLLSRDRIEWLNSRYDAYSRREVSELAICGQMVQVYAGHSVAEMRRAAATFFAGHMERHIFPELARLVRELQRCGTDIWAVSSTCDWVIEEGVQRFGIPPERVLAARVAMEEGRVTDRLLEVPTDEGKVAALARVGIMAPDAVFGNSIHDAAMLRTARAAFPVNPSPQLAAEAALQGWPVFHPGPATRAPK